MIEMEEAEEEEEVCKEVGKEADKEVDIGFVCLSGVMFISIIFGKSPAFDPFDKLAVDDNDAETVEPVVLEEDKEAELFEGTGGLEEDVVKTFNSPVSSSSPSIIPFKRSSVGVSVCISLRARSACVCSCRSMRFSNPFSVMKKIMYLRVHRQIKTL